MGDEECQCDRSRWIFIRDDDGDLGGVAVDNELTSLVMRVSMTISIARAGLPGAIQKAIGKCRAVSEFALVGAAGCEQSIQTSREDGGVAPHAADDTGADQVRGTDGICERIVWVQQKKPLLS